MLLKGRALQLAGIATNTRATRSGAETAFATGRTKALPVKGGRVVNETTRRRLYALRTLRRNKAANPARQTRGRNVATIPNFEKRRAAAPGRRKQAVTTAGAAYLRAKAHSVSLIVRDEDKVAEMDTGLLNMSLRRATL